MQYVRSTTTLPGGNQGSRFANCPAGKVVIAGGCGHRDFNTAALDIIILQRPKPVEPVYTVALHSGQQIL